MTASTDPAGVARGLSEAMRALLLTHYGRVSSLLLPHALDLKARRSAYWDGKRALTDRIEQPNFMVREALIRRSLLEPYHDCAGLTPLGLAVCVHLRAIPTADAPPTSTPEIQ